jgi:two-component system sensor histidine kinase HydH
MTSRIRPRLIAFARLGLLLALIALGVVLVLSAHDNRSEATRLSALLDRGQSERFFHPVPRIHERNHGPASQADLDELLQQFHGEGLRYLAELEQDGSLIVEAGQHAGAERPRPEGTSMAPVLVGDRARVTFRPPPHLELPILIMEFEPTVSNQLRQRADEGFWFSLAAAFVLWALTLGLWLALAREQRSRDKQERERHLASLGEMSAVLAHEIRNPLASLKGTAQLLGEQLDATSPLQRKVSRIVDEAKRLEDLSSTLLDLVRSSSVAPAPVDPTKLMRDAAQALALERLELEHASAPATWPLDALRMDQVLKNLLQNAQQAASNASSPIEAFVGVERGKLVMRIRDHGPGLPPGAEHKIFEPFHTTRTHGTGLGLAVARRIVELHGGQIRAENHAQGGALFTLTLPG